MGFRQSDRDLQFLYPMASRHLGLPSWPRFLIGVSGASLALYGARRRDLGGGLVFLLGVGALVRSITNIETIQLIRLLLYPAIVIKRTIDVDAPIRTVFEFLRNPSNYSRFMSYVQSVELNERQRLVWTVVGPVGVRVQWETSISVLQPNLCVAWRSFPGSPVTHIGSLSFMGLNHDRTRVHVTMTYAPPAGAFGLGIIRLLGFDPALQIDQDLQKMKKMIESEYHSSISLHLASSYGSGSGSGSGSTEVH